MYNSHNSHSPWLHYERLSQLAAVEWEGINHNTSHIATLQVDLYFPLNFTQVMREVVVSFIHTSLTIVEKSYIDLRTNISPYL